MAGSLYLKLLDDCQVRKEKCVGLPVHKMQIAIHFLATVTEEDEDWWEFAKY